MSEIEAKPGSSMPWANVFALLAACGSSLFALLPSLNSSRPPDPGSGRMNVFGDQTVTSRLWQDPYEEVTKDFAVVSKSGGPLSEVHSVANMKDRLRFEMSKGESTNSGVPGEVSVMIVMVNSGPHAEARERRLRTRTAVIGGLSVGGYAPRRSTHIGYLMAPWPRLSEQLHLPDAAGSKAELEPIPFEWFDRPKEDLRKPSGMLVLWLHEDTCADEPFTRLAYLSYLLGLNAVDGDRKSDGKRYVPTTVLGPASSTVFEKMVVQAIPMAAGVQKAKDAPVKTPDEKYVFIDRELAGVKLISPTATVSDGVLLPLIEEAAKLEQKRTQSKRRPDQVKKLFSEALPKVTFHRTIWTDGDVIWAIIDELARRQIRPKSWVDDASQPLGKSETKTPGQGDSVAIISELDTFYGRALPVTFLEQCTTEKFTDLMTRNCGNSHPWIATFHYLRGLDGRLPGDSAEKKAGDATTKEDRQQRPGARPDGHDQTDSLLRLAHLMQEEDRRQRSEGKQGFRAIGILGSDVYDKLLILRALRPAFPGVLFFTNNLDAQLAQPEELAVTQNLVVVSPFGLHLSPLWQRNIPPFRDSYQTATFFGLLIAMGKIDEETTKLKRQVEVLKDNGPLDLETQLTVHWLEKGLLDPQDFRALMDSPRIFEIGRNGALDLSINYVGGLNSESKLTGDPPQDTKNGLIIPRLHPLRADLKQWWSPSVRHATMFFGKVPVWLATLLLTVSSLAFALLFVTGVLWVRTQPLVNGVPSQPPQEIGAKRLRRVCGRAASSVWKFSCKSLSLFTTAAVLTGGVIAVGIVSIAYRAQWLQGEPFAWFSGLSIWPAVAIRILAVVLAVHFVCKCYCRILVNDTEILEQLGLGSGGDHCAESVGPNRFLKQCFLPWTVDIKQENPNPVGGGRRPHDGRSIPAQELWCQYIWRGRLCYRLTRVAACLALYLIACLCAFAAFDSGLPQAPVRSLAAFYFDNGSMILLLVSAAALTLFIVDALLLNTSFIRLLSNGLTIWPELTLDRSGRRGALGDNEIAEILDIKLIATRTEAVGELVLYPFVVIALLVVSRMPYFDNWGWTSGIVIALSALLFLATLAAFRMRRAAEEARSDSLRRLRHARVVASASAVAQQAHKVRILDDAISEIKETSRGAFAPLSHQPIIRALLYPAGGVGIWEMARQLVSHV